MDKYFMFFRVNTGTDKGKELCSLLDCGDSRIHWRGFQTKSKMLQFIANFEGGIEELQMLKPIT